MSAKAGAHTYPPLVEVGPALQPGLPPPIAAQMRARREELAARLSELRAGRRKANESGRERFDAPIAALVEQVKTISDMIREAEAVR